MLDDRTLLIPDRPGNNRLDTLSNLLSNPAVGLLFVVPGFDDTMRVNGQARVTVQPDLLARLEVEGRAPRAAIVVTVEEVFIHCAKAFRRSRLWDPRAQQDRAAMPSLVEIVRDQAQAPRVAPDELQALEAALEEEYRQSMY